MRKPKVSSEAVYVAYYRASTEEQRKGLGLDVQKYACLHFVDKYGGSIIEEIFEIVPGRAEVRTGFNKAIGLCKKHKAILLVHKIERLARGGFMALATMERKRIPYVEADSPYDSDFSKNIKFLIAKEESEKIQKRAREAMGQIKKNIAKDGYHISKTGNRITSLGNPQNLSDEGRERSSIVRKAKALANENNRRAYEVVKNMKSRKSLQKMANYLNNNGFQTSTGKKFHAMQVSNLIKLYTARKSKNI